MRHTTHILFPLLLLAGCADQSNAPLGLDNPDSFAAAKPGGGVSDPTATWIFPAAEGALGFASDGTNLVYANGVCGVSAKIFATSAASNSGDATIQTAKAHNCQRRFTLRYPDAFTEVVPSFNNLLGLHNTTYSIPIGTTVRRRLILNPGAIANNPSRCGRLLFGPSGTVGVGSDSLEVTRLDASTWQVQSEGSSLAYCEASGALYSMPVSFTVVSSRPL